MLTRRKSWRQDFTSSLTSLMKHAGRGRGGGHSLADRQGGLPRSVQREIGRGLLMKQEGPRRGLQRSANCSFIHAPGVQLSVGLHHALTSHFGVTMSNDIRRTELGTETLEWKLILASSGLVTGTTVNSL